MTDRTEDVDALATYRAARAAAGLSLAEPDHNPARRIDLDPIDAKLDQLDAKLDAMRQAQLNQGLDVANMNTKLDRLGAKLEVLTTDNAALKDKLDVALQRLDRLLRHATGQWD